MKDYSELVLEGDPELFIQNEILLSFKRSTPHRTLSFTKNLLEHLTQSHPSSICRDIFILGDDATQCAKLRETFGILILADTELKDQIYVGRPSIKKFISKGDFFKRSSQIGKYINGWSSVLKGFKLFSLNALIINDSYLFDQLNQDRQVENLMGVLSGILPDKLGISLDVLILTINSRGRINNQKLSEFTEHFGKRFQESYNVKLNLSILTHSDPDLGHERLIISNYHYMSFDKGLITFIGEKAHCRNKVDLCDAYTSIFGLGDTEIHRISSFLNDVRKIVRQRMSDSEKSDYFPMSGNGSNRLLDFYSR